MAEPSHPQMMTVFSKIVEKGFALRNDKAAHRGEACTQLFGGWIRQRLLVSASWIANNCSDR